MHSIYNSRRRHGDEAETLLPPSRSADRPVRRRTRPTKHTRHGDGSIRFIIFDDAMETKPKCCRPHGQQSDRCEDTHGRRSTRVRRTGAFDL